MSLLSWTQAEDENSFLHPAYGTPWVKVGTGHTYEPAKWGNGHRLAQNGRAWRYTLISPSEFSITLYLKAEYNWNDGADHGILHDTAGNSYFEFYKTSANKFAVQIYTVPAVTPASVANFTPTAFASGDEIALCITFNKNNSAGNKIKVMQEASPLSVSSYTDYSGGFAGGSNIMYDTGYYYGSASNGVIDNIRNYSHEIDQATAILDRDYESGVAPILNTYQIINC